MGRLGSRMRASSSFQIIPRPMDRLGLGLGSGPHVAGRLGSGTSVSASFHLQQIGLY